MFGQAISPDLLSRFEQTHYAGVKGSDFDVAKMVDMAGRVSGVVDQSALEQIVRTLQNAPNAPFAKTYNKIRSILGFNS